MMRRNRSIISGIDWWTILLFLVITLFGWMNIYGAGYTFEQTSIWDFSNRAGKQLVWIISAVVMGVVIMLIDEKIYDVLAYVIYGLMIVILLITPFITHDIKGSLSWITIGPISLQPAEFAKCATALALAKYMGRYGYQIRDWRDLIVPFALIGVPMFIIMVLQREAGSALVFIAFLLVLYRQGMSDYVLLFGLISAILFILVIYFGGVPIPLGIGNVGNLVGTLLIETIIVGWIFFKEHLNKPTLFLIGGIALIFGVSTLLCIWLPVPFTWAEIVSGIYTIGFLIVFAVKTRKKQFRWLMGFVIIELIICQGADFVFQNVLKEHQRTRVEELLGLRDDPTGAGYNVNQSLIAIGSGQFTGKGYLQGTQTKLRFVPEQDTDFIFCTVGEEWGFVGSSILLLLYLTLILRIIFIAERQKDVFSMIFAYCVASILLFHVTINIGMVLGILPVIGIPLPFFSYGGSSLWGFTILLALLLRMDAARVNKMQ